MNLDNFKISTIAKIFILILAALAGYFIWRISQTPTEPRPEQANTPPKNSAIEISVSDSAKQLKTIFLPSFSKEWRLFAPANETAAPFFENVREIAKTAETALKKEINSATKNNPVATPSPKIAKETPNEIVLSLTADEFHFLYPDSFIKSLIDAQDLFIKNFDPSYKPLLKIETDAQVRLVEEKIVTALVALNMLTGEEARRINTTIHFTLPKIQLAELEKQKSSLNQYFNFTPLTRPDPKGVFLAGLLEKFYSALVPKAEAAICGACYTTPECYQVGAPTPTPGPSLFRAFCYCTGCYYGQGCLDFCVGRAAIFDPITFICGCG